MSKNVEELEAELKAAEAAQRAEKEASLSPEVTSESTVGVEDPKSEVLPEDEVAVDEDMGSNYVATPENDGHPGYSPPNYGGDVENM